MATNALSLMQAFDGWKKHQLVLMETVTPLTPEQLASRLAPHLETLGGLLTHIATARLWWFYKMAAPGSNALANQLALWKGDRLNAEDPAELERWGNALEQQELVMKEHHDECIRWLELTWQMIEATLTEWTAADLAQTYRHTVEGNTYVVSRWWTIWRVMSHDLHHGGQVGLTLGIQGVEVPDKWWWGGMLTELPLAKVGG